MTTVAVVAGEVSGDLHGGNLVAALGGIRPDVAVWAVGGDRLRRAGASIVFPSERLGGMGLIEVLGRMPALLEARRRVLCRFRDDPPDRFVPVDFGGLNLRLATAARQLGIPVTYYIPPKVWAWGAWRVGTLRRAVDEALVVLPFEAEFLRARGVVARYVGSPVADHVGAVVARAEPDRVGLLPGSRPGEVSRIWPTLVAAARLLGADRPLRFQVPVAPGLPRGLLERGSEGLDLELVDGDSLGVMARSRVVLAASGTATLECALVGTPLVAIYRLNPLTYALGRLLVRAPFISLPNLILGREVVPELIQTPAPAVAAAARPLLDEGPPRRAMVDALAEVRRQIGGPGASEKAARYLAESLSSPDSPAPV